MFFLCLLEVGNKNYKFPTESLHNKAEILVFTENWPSLGPLHQADQLADGKQEHGAGLGLLKGKTVRPEAQNLKNNIKH